MNITLYLAEHRGQQRIHVKAPFEMKDLLKETFGSAWNKEAKAWTFPATTASAGELYKRLAGNVLDMDSHVQGLMVDAAREAQGIAHKTADDLDEIPGKLPAWLHQKRAYHFALGRSGTMLAMDMGTGKSRTAVSLLDGWGSSLAVIVCPRSVVNVWPNQFALHSERDWHVVAPPNRKTVAQRRDLIMKESRMAGALGKPFAVVVNYEAFWREPLNVELLDMLDAGQESVFIMDESHRIKAPGGKASMAAARLGSAASRRLQLTGTPMPHSPLDLYAQFRALDAGVFGTSFTKFRARYAVMGGYEGRQVLDYQNQGELSERFASASFIVSKADAGLDLPPEVHEEKVVQLEPKTMKLYKSFAEQMIAEVDEGTVTAQNALVKLLRLQQITSGYMRDDEGVDHEVDTTKQDVLVDVLSDLAPTEPVVVFCKFHHDLDAIHHVAAKLERRYGEISGRVGPGKAHYGLNEHSQMRDDIDILGVQLQSGGVGIDLTRSAYAVYYSMGYSLGDYVQSLARLHRPGQTRSVTYLHLIAAGTIDRVVYRALANRQEVVDAVLGAAKGGGFDTDEEV